MNTKRHSRVAVALVPLALLGCASESGSSAPPDYDFVTDVPGLMASVLDPAAETYWDAVGAILDFDGVHEFQPETEEEWEAVRHSAYVLAEAGNLLMMEGRAVDRGAWMGFSRDLIAVGRQAIEAAEAEDPQAVFDAGAEIYFVCSACHASYALQTLRPSDDRTDPVDVGSPETSGDEVPDPDGG